MVPESGALARLRLRPGGGAKSGWAFVRRALLRPAGDNYFGRLRTDLLRHCTRTSKGADNAHRATARSPYGTRGNPRKKERTRLRPEHRRGYPRARHAGRTREGRSCKPWRRRARVAPATREPGSCYPRWETLRAGRRDDLAGFRCKVPGERAPNACKSTRNFRKPAGSRKPQSPILSPGSVPSRAGLAGNPSWGWWQICVQCVLC